MKFYKKQNNFHQYTVTILVVFAFLFPLFSFSQNSIPGTPAHSKKTISAEFIFKEVEFQEMAVVSNVLKINNNNAKTYTFTIDISLPAGWNTLNNSKKEFSLAPGDSLFIPVRIVTKNKSAKGGTKYNINAYVTSIEGRQM